MIASLRLLGSLVVVTNVLEEVAGDSILHVIVVLTLGHNPWDVGVGWGESLSGLGNLVFILNGFLCIVARDDILNNVVGVGLGSAGLSKILVVGSLIGLLDAVDELEGLVRAAD